MSNENNFKMEKKIIQYHFLYLFKFLYFLLIIMQILSNPCERNFPIFKEGYCMLEYCTNNEFKNQTCILANEIIKTQWLNNIIWIGNNDFKYVNLASNSNGDLIIETTSNPSSPERKFYGLKRDGQPYFKNNQYINSLIVSDQEGIDNGRFEGEIFFVIINEENGGNKEYLVSVGFENQYIELYDFDNNNVSCKVPSATFFGTTISGVGSTSISYKLNINSKIYHYIIFGFISGSYFYLKKMNFSSIDIIGNNPIISDESFSQFFIQGNTVSCFITDSKIVICFNLILEGVLYQFHIIAFNQKLEKLKSKNLLYHMLSDYSYFYKCIHLKEETGVFIFYRSPHVGFSMIKNPMLIFKTYDSNSNSFSDYLSIEELELNLFEFNIDSLLNDIIKLSNNKICFISTSEDKEILYIVIIKILDKNNIIIRYYSLAIYRLYNHKFLSENRLHLYNNYISFAFNFITRESLINTAFMIFSYANGTDYDLHIIDILFDNNDFKIDDIELNLINDFKIENNIFGHVFKGIKIKTIKNCNGFELLSTIDENKYINDNSSLESNESIKLIFSNEIINSTICEIGYVYIITEPNFEEYNDYSINRIVYGVDTELTDFDNQKSEYESKIIKFNLIIKKNLSKKCNEINCELCLQNYPKSCITCNSNYTISKIEGEKRKICDHPEMTDIESTFISDIIKTESENITDFCTNEQILNNKCKEFLIRNEQFGEVYAEFKKKILKDDYDGENKIIETENVEMQISTLEYQKINTNPNISSVDLGECENLLRNKYNISKDKSLIIVKTDIKSEDLSSIYVQYELFHPITKKQLDLDICNKVQISINVPVNLNEETTKLYDRLRESGYNLFDSSDDFYNDICTTYTSESGTDMTLEDRKKEIYGTNGNISICQIGCKFESYLKSTQKAKCNCDIQKYKNIETNLEKINFSKEEIASSFLKTLKNSNFLVLKCFKLAFNFKNIFKNKGRIIMSVIFILFIISIIFYILKDKTQITKYINLILRNKINHGEIEINSKSKKLNDSVKSKKENCEKWRRYKTDNKDTNKNEIRTKNKNKNKKKHKNKEIKLKKKSKSKKDEKDGPPKRKKNLEIISSKNSENIKINERKIILSTSSNHINKNLIKLNKNINERTSIESIINREELKNREQKNKIINETNNDNITYILRNHSIKKNKSKFNKNTFQEKFNNINGKNYNDQELNTLEYEFAIIIDKRTYFQYYWSLLKKKQLILFTILPANDYNLFSLKIALFLLSFSLYFTINGFFFSDETMHKIYEDKGAFNIILQIPQILYSSIISGVVNMILKFLSLSENNILALKQETDFKKAKKNSKIIKKCINIKFILFFILSVIFLSFFWYFISCFCAVYANTQIILIKDTLVSFSLSMLYPFGLNLLPGLFRIPALKAKNKNKKFLYKISGLIALI